MLMKTESNQNTLSNVFIRCQLGRRRGSNSILQRTDFKRLLFDLKCFSLSLNISIQYFQSERTSELSQSLGAVKCNSREIIITTGKKKKKKLPTSCFSLSSESEIWKGKKWFSCWKAGPGNDSLWVGSCVHTRLCRIAWSEGEGRREDGHERLEGSVT